MPTEIKVIIEQRTTPAVVALKLGTTALILTALLAAWAMFLIFQESLYIDEPEQDGAAGQHYPAGQGTGANYEALSLHI